MPRQERERRYIAEYLREAFPEGDYQLNVELGPIPQEYVTRMGFTKAAAMFRPTRPRVDAVKWGPGKYILIEAKIRDIKAGIGDLLYYRNIIPETIDLPEYVGQPITTRLVIPWSLDWLAPVAAANNIEIVVFEPGRCFAPDDFTSLPALVEDHKTRKRAHVEPAKVLAGVSDEDGRRDHLCLC